jgi:hypothetical protein
MTTTTEAPPTQTENLVERLFAAAIDTVEIASVHIGGRLGFYRALADGGDATPGELAARTGTAERYVREWLEQQAVAGFLSVDDPDAEAGDRRYGLPAEHRPVFVDEENLNYLTPLAAIAVDVLGPLEQLLTAYRTGDGVPFEAYGVDLVEAIGAINRPQFMHLVAEWLAAIPEVDARLRATPLPASPTSRPARLSRASRSPAPTRRCRSTPSTSTRHQWQSPRPTSPARGWPTACGRSSTTPATLTWAGVTTWSRSSRPFTT